MVKTFKSREHKEGVAMKGFLVVTLQCGHDMITIVFLSEKMQII